ncbi:MAG: glycoside hydrolase/phage tail family protein [Pseudomonadota bacterium]
MATVVLQTVGTAIGGAVAGPFGAMVGRAAGALAGNAIDQSFLSKDHVVNGPRLDSTRLQTSSEGSPIPRVYGQNRVSGQIIWATRFEERTRSQETGGKGGGSGTTTNTFSYHANFAVGICEGPVSHLRRVWADGEELDLTSIEYRFYRGDETQYPDPLIEAKQGSGNAPAYRGTSYIVFEDFALERFGNRLPQMSFEIVHAFGRLEQEVNAITIIPGSTEYGYDPQIVTSGGGDEQFDARNRHVSWAQTDWQASLDELQAVCPNLEQVALVVTWFGTDLRAGECQLVPGVTDNFHTAWQVGTFQRHTARLLSNVNGKPAFGGTPDDASVIRAIEDLRQRGLKVVLYPFLMMDIPVDNTLPNPAGGSGQPAYPWRGEITCFPGLGEPGTADRTSAARQQLATFSQRYRAFIEHYVQLCVDAGGVDGFLVGSELRGLTRVRDGNGQFPFVKTLMESAAHAKQELGSDCFITYGADWSEYFGYQPQDGSGDVLYNLDPLWASPSIDAVGIDNYMPLSDLRSGRDPLGNARSPHDLEYLQNAIASGEGYEWYYASHDDRLEGLRTPITDGQGEPWIFRYKDIHSWWSLPHHERKNGIRLSQPTQWLPQSKPFFMTELGCPAIDAGANQPNVFVDPKSAQSAFPVFSNQTRDDLIQRRFLEAHFNHWAMQANNPVSAVYGGSMVDLKHVFPWAWDARPFPAFPARSDLWSDGGNWHRGHWLNGRLGACSIQDLVQKILLDFGYANAEVTLDGVVDGYVIPAPTSARAALEPLLALFDAHVFEVDGKLLIRQAAYCGKTTLSADDLVFEEGAPQRQLVRKPQPELAAEAVLSHVSVFGDYEDRASKSRRTGSSNARQISMQAPAVITESVAVALADARLRREWAGSESLVVRLSHKDIAITAGDIITLEGMPNRQWLVEQAEMGSGQELRLRSVSDIAPYSSSFVEQSQAGQKFQVFGPPELVLMDLPALKSEEIDKIRFHVALAAQPWAGRYSILSSSGLNWFVNRGVFAEAASVGRLLTSLESGFAGRVDLANSPVLSLRSANLETRALGEILNGSNVFAIEARSGDFEIMQFADAELLEDGNWRIGRLLRGLLGTEEEAQAGAAVGAKVVLLNQQVSTIDLLDREIGLEQNWRAGPTTASSNGNSFSQQTATFGARSRRLFRPVHLRLVTRTSQTLEFGWIRSGRVNSDSWDIPEIPLDVAVERYRIRFVGADGSILHETIVPQTAYACPVDEIASGAGVTNAVFTIEVCQLADTGLPGSPAILQFSI